MLHVDKYDLVFPKDGRLLYPGLRPKESAFIQDFSVRVAVADFEVRLAMERESWEVQWKTIMGAWDLEHIIPPMYG